MAIFRRNSAENDQVSPETAVNDAEFNEASSGTGRFDFDGSEDTVQERPVEHSSKHDYFESYVSALDLASGPQQEEEDEPEERRDKRFELLETGDIVWSWILMCIPVIGWLVALLWALGVCRKRQRRYLARAFLTLMLIAVVLCLIAYAFYTLVFRLRLEDLPTVMSSIYNWIWNAVASLFGKKID